MLCVFGNTSIACNTWVTFCGDENLYHWHNVLTCDTCYVAPRIDSYSYMKTFRKSDSVARNNKTSSASNKKKVETFYYEKNFVKSRAIAGKWSPMGGILSKRSMFFNRNRRVSPGKSRIVSTVIQCFWLIVMPLERNCHLSSGIISGIESWYSINICLFIWCQTQICNPLHPLWATFCDYIHWSLWLDFCAPAQL